MGKSYTPEFRDQLVKTVIDTRRTMSSVADEFGVSQEALRTGGKKERVRRGEAGEPTGETPEQKMARLEKENRELRMKIDFLGKATAFFAKEYR